MCVYDSKYIIIEIAVHHQVDQVKSNKIQTLNIPAIEISLTDLADKPWNWGNLTQEVLFSAQRRKWLWQPESTPAEQIIKKDLSDPVISTEKREWVFDIGGRWV